MDKATSPDGYDSATGPLASCRHPAARNLGMIILNLINRWAGLSKWVFSNQGSISHRYAFQIAAGRLLTGERRRDRTAPVLFSLRWLPVVFLGSSPKIYELFLRVRVGVGVSLSGTALPYFSELLPASHSRWSAEVNKATALENSQIRPEAEAMEPFQWRWNSPPFHGRDLIVLKHCWTPDSSRYPTIMV